LQSIRHWLAGWASNHALNSSTIAHWPISPPLNKNPDCIGAVPMTSARRRFAATLCFAFVLPLAAQPFSPEMFSGLAWRDVGPMRGGRGNQAKGRGQTLDRPVPFFQSRLTSQSGWI
jgi:hypothetical protein